MNLMELNFQNFNVINYEVDKSNILQVEIILDCECNDGYFQTCCVLFAHMEFGSALTLKMTHFSM